MTDNKFSAIGSSLMTGYAVSITPDNPTLCLDFVANTTTPIDSPAPYLFFNNFSTFNVTAESAQSANTGTSEKIGFIPLVIEESVLAYVGFASNFSPSLALCAGTKLLSPEEKFGRPPCPATDSSTTLGIPTRLAPVRERMVSKIWIDVADG